MDKKYLSFSIPGKPIAKARPRFFVRKTKNKGKQIGSFDKQKSESGKFIVQVLEQLPKDFTPYERDIPLYVDFNFYWPIPKSTSKKKRKLMNQGEIRPITRPDADNMIKFVKDCCNGIVWNDDSQIVAGHFRKMYSDNPRTEFFVHVENDIDIPF